MSGEIKPTPGTTTSVTLNVTFEIHGVVSPDELMNITRKTLYHVRDEVGFDFADEESFVEGIIVTPNHAD